MGTRNEWDPTGKTRNISHVQVMVIFLETEFSVYHCSQIMSNKNSYLITSNKHSHLTTSNKHIYD